MAYISSDEDAEHLLVQSNLGISPGPQGKIQLLYTLIIKCLA